MLHHYAKRICTEVYKWRGFKSREKTKNTPKKINLLRCWVKFSDVFMNSNIKTCIAKTELMIGGNM